MVPVLRPQEERGHHHREGPALQGATERQGRERVQLMAALAGPHSGPAAVAVAASDGVNCSSMLRLVAIRLPSHREAEVEAVGPVEPLHQVAQPRQLLEHVAPVENE